jgi:putative ATP-dependent endonuclease of OLD family
MSAPHILRLKIERFRGMAEIDWLPGPGLNVILGGGDVGKTTLLDSIALLLSPVNPSTVPDTDYLGRASDQGFSIEALIAIPAVCGIGGLMKPAWPWQWTGTEAIVPSIEEGVTTGEPVYRIRVRGTEDLELQYEILQPNGDSDSFPVALRRAIGLVRLGGDDRNDRDLRLVHGSALDRLLSDQGMRSRMAATLTGAEIAKDLADDKRDALNRLSATFQQGHLPSGLDLQITGGQSASIASMVGLTAKRDGVLLPLATWGAGTRRMAALTIAEQNQAETPITLVDEVERGLEPYRQHVLVNKLAEAGTQAFVTSHSPAAIAAAAGARLWYIDHAGGIGEISGDVAKRHRQNDPALFLSRMAVVAEGKTEQGFVLQLLEWMSRGPLERRGIHVCDGGGHENALELLEALSRANLQFGGFADEEGKHPARWKAVGDKMGALLFRWEKGSTEEEIIGAVPEGRLEELVTDPEGVLTGRRLRSLAERLDLKDKDWATISAAAGENLRQVIIDAALGRTPTGKDAREKEFKSDARNWFKSIEGGRELATKLHRLGLRRAFFPRLMPFLSSVLRAAP